MPFQDKWVKGAMPAGHPRTLSFIPTYWAREGVSGGAVDTLRVTHLSQSFHACRKPCLIQEASELEISTGLNNRELHALAFSLFP